MPNSIKRDKPYEAWLTKYVPELNESEINHLEQLYYKNRHCLQMPRCLANTFNYQPPLQGA